MTSTVCFASHTCSWRAHCLGWISWNSSRANQTLQCRLTKGNFSSQSDSSTQERSTKSSSRRAKSLVHYSSKCANWGRRDESCRSITFKKNTPKHVRSKLTMNSYSTCYLRLHDSRRNSVHAVLSPKSLKRMTSNARVDNQAAFQNCTRSICRWVNCQTRR